MTEYYTTINPLDRTGTVHTMSAEQGAVLRRLCRRARRWGGDIVQVPEDKFGALKLTPAPFTPWDLGADHAKKIVYFSDYEMPEGVCFFGINIIHEMGHAFACKTSPQKMFRHRPQYDEFSFFGWEIALALRVGFTIDEFWEVNADYSVDRGEQIGNLTPRRREWLRKERISTAKDLGLLKNGIPVSIR